MCLKNSISKKLLSIKLIVLNSLFCKLGSNSVAYNLLYFSIDFIFPVFLIKSSKKGLFK